MPRGGRYLPPTGPRPYDEPKLKIVMKLGVTRERAIEIILARRFARKCRAYRKRSRMRALVKNPNAKKFAKFDGLVVKQGEGELEPLMRVIGMTQAEFLRMSGIDESNFFRWYGHPLYKWPVELVKHVGWARAMADELKRHGIDPEQFKPKMPKSTVEYGFGQYPRTTEQGKKFHFEPPPE